MTKKQSMKHLMIFAAVTIICGTMALTSCTNELGAGKNVHSLERERVNGVVMNTDAWYDLFDVKPGDKFYRKPEERVHIW